MRLVPTLVGVFGVVAGVSFLFAGGMPNDCVSLAANGGANAAMLRGMAGDPAKGAPGVCEGVALLTEGNGSAAAAQLRTARDAAPAADRWLIQGFYARAVALSGNNELALQHWGEAIDGARAARNTVWEIIFRGDRAATHAKRRHFASAHAEYAAIHALADNDRLRAVAASNALKAAVEGGNHDAAEKWYGIALTAIEGAEDEKTLVDAGVIYSQSLDDRGLAREAADVRRRAIALSDKMGSDWASAELRESEGQARFQSGDYAGGQQEQDEAAARYRAAGDDEYASFVTKNAAAHAGRYEAGHVCEDRLAEGKARAAIASVTSVPVSRRSFQANACLVRAYQTSGNTARASRELIALAAGTGGGGWKCDVVEALAQRQGVAAPAPCGSEQSQAPRSLS